jgi:tRNA G18 (ribose-2'-O)-methylase SpoU
VLRLLASDFEVESVLAAESYVPQVRPLLTRRPETTLLVVPDAVVPNIAGFNFHRGLLACGVRRPNPPLVEICPPLGEPALLVVCTDVQGPENLGQIIRTGCALGVDGIVSGPKAGDPFSRRVLRVSMGGAFSLPIYESVDLAADLRRLQTELAVQLTATVLDADATPLDRFTSPPRTAVLFGSEGHGLQSELIALCDHRITIPMSRGTDSLNVAVAAGIILNAIRFNR